MHRNIEQNNNEIKSSEKNISSGMQKEKLPERTAYLSRKLTPAQRQDFYKKQGLDNLSENESAINSSRYQKDGLSPETTKMSSKNIDKLMQNRGLNKSETNNVKNSFDRSEPIIARNAKKGEPVVVTHGTEPSSGNYVSKESSGKTPSERIDKLALPHTNPATHETNATLDKNQDVLEGKIASQSKFQKLDPEGKPRNGGGRQIITDGGYKSGAIRNVDSKFPAVLNKNEVK